MISIEGVPEPGASIDAFEGSLLFPIPGQQKNTIVIEDRDGSNVQRLSAKAAEMSRNGKTVFKVKDVKIDVFITDARVAFACSKYDKGGGWIGGAGAMIVLNAGSKALAALRRRGKMMVGQVRYPWIQNVGSTSKSGWLSEERLVFDAKTSADDGYRLTLLLPKDVDASRAAAEIARRAAAYRLAAETELKDDERSGLEKLTQATPITSAPTDDKNKIHFFQMPTFWFMNDKSARLRPGASADSEVAVTTT